MVNVFNFIIDSISTCFSLMQKFSFMGTNLFNFLLAITVIGVLLPVVINLTRSSVSSSRREYVKSANSSRKV